ncbi:hypothetical protein HUT18_29615 [Streptomyces sp. NA04227]|uniref:hypothetical protein n=1 Tax=Streptomyces sp. NA04227 TaxID=2742136 RepID=UPI0015920BAB|nr:hypothetical protein [Streptomyces sp. NA04227]QKW09953.1 hypothetical protein HUT18_29615 [Streptomyces sp. NA04227]
MDPTILAAVIGVPATVTAAAIAYPVGRAVARRQADDQHAQWLRTQRQAASTRLTDAATQFIEAAVPAWEAVARPEYAHTRRRDLESRTRLDPALYEPLKQALREMHNALPAVALHGPESVSQAGTDLHDAAVAMTGAILSLDESCVFRSVCGQSFRLGTDLPQRIQAATDDLDTAYARLAAPLGLPEFSSRAGESLLSSAVAATVARFGASLDDPAAAAEAGEELRRIAAEDESMGPHVEPLLGLLPVARLLAMGRAGSEGEQLRADDVMEAVSGAVPSLLGTLASVSQVYQNPPLPEDVDLSDLPFGLTGLLESLAGIGEAFAAPIQLMSAIQQHLAVGDELVAELVANPPEDPFLWFYAVRIWDGHLARIAVNGVGSMDGLNAVGPRLYDLLMPVLDAVVDAENGAVSVALEKVVSARIDFIDGVRDAIAA